jgi:H+-transporting ATPase
MADTHDSSTGSDTTPPNHLGTTVPSGGLDGSHDPEKTGHDDTTPPPTAETTKKEAPGDDDEEEEDMDALIEELESQDGQVEEEEETNEPGGEVRIPEELLATDTRTGLTEAEVHNRRKKYGLNQMKEEKENLILKFLGYFIGPIQFVMEVSPSLQKLPARSYPWHACRDAMITNLRAS